MRPIILAISLLLGCFVVPAVAADDAAVLAEATRAFEQGAAMRTTHPAESRALLEQAVAAYTSLLRSRENGHLRYNLGNAYALLGDRGRATLEYRRASRMLGVDRDLRSNMALLGDPGDVRPSMGARLDRAALYWRGLLPPVAVWWIGVAGAALCWTAVGVGALRPRLRGVRWVGAIGALVAVMCLGSLWYESWRAAAAPEVVVLEPARGYKGPDDRAYEPSFDEPLTPGMAARVVEQRAGWSRLRLIDGRDTWIPSDLAEPLLPTDRAAG